ncbi:pentapeptide repeat-containing protein [Achromobacter animicus]|uniref:pentapeptide repeat-containing protein n=1 Tax=Achromobacter animicus TaxID=1389935 RepID=UPI003917FFD1
MPCSSRSARPGKRRENLRQANLRHANLRRAILRKTRRRRSTPPAIPDQPCGSAINRPVPAASSSRSLKRATASANTRA